MPRPSRTASTMVAKLSSVKVMSAAPFATSVPVIPIAQPMSAALRAGADFAEWARKISQDPHSAKQGGLLPWIGPNQTLKEFEDVAYRYASCIRDLTDVTPEINESKAGNYKVSVTAKADRLKILEFFGYTGKELALRVNLSNLEQTNEDCCSKAFIRGAFLVCGSITDPEILKKKKKMKELGKEYFWAQE